MGEEDPRFGESEDYHFKKLEVMSENREIRFFRALWHPIASFREDKEYLYHVVGFLIAKVNNLLE